jgi:hypothetical protein
VLQRAFDADENLGEDTKRFIDRHMGPGEKATAGVSSAGHRRRCELVAERPASSAARAQGLRRPRIVAMIPDMENPTARYRLSAEQCRRRADAAVDAVSKASWLCSPRSG